MMFRTLATITVVLLSGISVSGCVDTRITSMRDPAFPNAHYKKLIVQGTYQDFDLVRGMEGSMVRALWKEGVCSAAANYIMPPLREYATSEIDSIFRQQRADALLLITPTGASSLTVTDVYANRYAAGATTHESLSDVSTDIKLFDLASGKLVWRGQAKSHIPHDGYGNAWGDYGGVINTLAEGTVGKLIQERFLLRAPQWYVDSVNDALRNMPSDD